MDCEEAVSNSQNQCSATRIRRFTYTTVLDLDVGYYIIRLDQNASKICTIIFPLGKYSCLRLSIGIFGSLYIFQAKMSHVMVTLEFVRTYLDDVLFITKGSLKAHLEKLKMVLIRLQNAGLKVNTP